MRTQKNLLVWLVIARNAATKRSRRLLRALRALAMTIVIIYPNTPVSLAETTSSLKRLNTPDGNTFGVDPKLGMPSPIKDKASEEPWFSQPVTHRENLILIAGNSHVIRFNRAIKRISVSDPEVADVALLNAKEVLVNSKIRGAANLIVWDLNDEILIYNLTVTGDPAPLRNALNSINPNNPIEVFPTEKGFVVNGDVGTVEAQEQIAKAAEAFSKDSISIVTVKEARQILLEIRFIQVNKTTGFNFGLDFNLETNRRVLTHFTGATGASYTTDTDPVTGTSVARYAVPSDQVLRGFTNYSWIGKIAGADVTGDHTFKALEDKNIVKIIARPNLLVRDGEKASFLVGGEFPVPITTNNTVTVDYKKFGTQLTYEPRILKDNRIRLKVAAEVSLLDAAAGVTVSSIAIPGLDKRSAETVAELESGKTLIIGGLLQQKKSSVEGGTPYLRRIPFIGRFFEKSESSWEDVELIILVTPRIIDAEKDALDLNKVKIDDPVHTAIEMEKPPFEDKRAMAIEKELIRFEKERNIEDTAEDRRLELDKLFKEFTAEKEKKRREEFQKLIREELHEKRKSSKKTS